MSTPNNYYSTNKMFIVIFFYFLAELSSHFLYQSYKQHFREETLPTSVSDEFRNKKY